MRSRTARSATNLAHQRYLVERASEQRAMDSDGEQWGRDAGPPRFKARVSDAFATKASIYLVNKVDVYCVTLACAITHLTAINVRLARLLRCWTRLR